MHSLITHWKKKFTADALHSVNVNVLTDTVAQSAMGLRTGTEA